MMINGTLMIQGKVVDLGTSVVVSDRSGAGEICGQTVVWGFGDVNGPRLSSMQVTGSAV